MATQSTSYTSSQNICKKSIYGIFKCWETLAKEDKNENDMNFIKRIDTLKIIIKFHPTWNIYKKIIIPDIEPDNITNAQYLDWYHTLKDYNPS